MPVSPARRVAYRVLRRVESGSAFAADLLRSAGSSLSEPDRHLATELVLGTLRRRAELHLWIERLSGRPLRYFDPEVLTILQLGVYQIRHLGRVPKAAAVNEAVEMARAVRRGSASGLVNAVLRKCEPQDRNAGAEPDSESARLALPDWLRERWTERFGRGATLALGRWSLKAPRLVVRLTGDGEVEAVRQALADRGVEASLAQYATRALVIERGSLPRLGPLEELGLVAQEEASQLVGSLTAPEAGQRVLDLCAAPGMKAAQIAAELVRGELVCCDRSAPRLRSMAHVTALIPKQVAWARVQLDAALPLPFEARFDRILVDAPCSGTGTLARNPEIKWRLSAKDLLRHSRAQARMLAGALEALKPDGRLVYSTCSLEPEENEQVVESALAATREFRRLERAELVARWHRLAPLFDEKGYFRTRPDLHGMDGFFAAVLVRAR